MNSNILDVRTRMLAFAAVSVYLGLDSIVATVVLWMATVGVVVLFWKEFLREWRVIALGMLWIGSVVVLAWVLGYSDKPTAVLVTISRWIAFIASSVVIFSSLNAYELVTGLVYFRLPTRLALAIGIGIRFIPIFVVDAVEVYRETRRRHIGFNSWAIGRYGVTGVTGRFFSPLLTAALRRMEAVWLSVVVHELETRVGKHMMTRLGTLDWLVLGFGAATLFVVVLDIAMR